MYTYNLFLICIQYIGMVSLCRYECFWVVCMFSWSLIILHCLSVKVKDRKKYF